MKFIYILVTKSLLFAQGCERNFEGVPFGVDYRRYYKKRNAGLPSCAFHTKYKTLRNYLSQAFLERFLRR